MYITSINLYSQDISIDSNSTGKKDSICYMLKFKAGDTLIYKVISFDSISIDFDTPLMRYREERIAIVCDAIDTSGHFLLSQSLIEYKGIENHGEEKDVERKTSAWIGRVVKYEIDSLGNRFSYTLDDSSKAALTPGGSFQPYLIFPFQKSCKTVNETWIAESTDDIPENGIPVPLIHETLLCRARENIDTLNEKCMRFEFIKTGQGNMKVMTEKEPIQVTSVINGFGKLDISMTKFIPIHFFCTLEQKLTLHFADNTTKPGLHYINANFTLESIKHYKEVPKQLKTKSKQHGRYK
ncbi:MAG: hypothetical protein ABSG15_05325 [FCB group bacterium]